MEGETACRFHKITTSFPLPPLSPVTRNIKDFQRHQVFEHSRFYDRNPSQRSIILIIQFKFPYSFLCIYIWGSLHKILNNLKTYFLFCIQYGDLFPEWGFSDAKLECLCSHNSCPLTMWDLPLLYCSHEFLARFFSNIGHTWF